MGVPGCPVELGRRWRLLSEVEKQRPQPAPGAPFLQGQEAPGAQGEVALRDGEQAGSLSTGADGSQPGHGSRKGDSCTSPSNGEKPTPGATAVPQASPQMPAFLPPPLDSLLGCASSLLSAV